MSATKFCLGERAILEIDFTDPENSDALFDPEIVRVTVCDPSDTLTHYEYEEDDELERVAEGQYRLELDLDETGMWQYRWHSHGDGQAATQRDIEVLPSRTPSA